MEFVLATNNEHKLQEFRRILEPAGHRVLSLSDISLVIDPEETGTTFAENSLQKARAVYDACGCAVLADDSGLEVDALGGAPGIYSARFAGEGRSTGENNKKLLRLLHGVDAGKRTARFRCAISLVLPSGATLQTDGTCEGFIGEEPAGENGFGYDPLFYVNGRSYAQLSSEEKDAISHRARALEQLESKLPCFLRENGYT